MLTFFAFCSTIFMSPIRQSWQASNFAETAAAAVVAVPRH
jgi:hypothetical protein